MKANKVLIAHEQIGFVADALPAKFEVLKAWEPMSSAEKDSITAIVVAGDVSMENSYLAQFRNLGLIACLTTGYDGVDVFWAADHGIRVTRAVEVNHEDVADHAMGLLIAWTRELTTGDAMVRAGAWNASVKVVTRSLSELSVGIVGMGAIGKAVASRCLSFGMPVFWWGPREKEDVPFRRASDLESLARDNNVLIVASSADKSNRHMISGRVLDELGPDGLLVNVARGSLVDEEALIERLKLGRLGGAALDVFEQEPTDPTKWRGVPNIILTPHSAGATQAVLPRLVAQLISNLEAHFGGRELVTPIAA
ncbi:lactate dehydrogenase-like 2-hydroxyacid dehydrogenase [Rhizobium leguminosarum]|uniref:Lactate dehydrogenase-like 2-hydroxyacid dehydrogenase n=1 Tax=Rhizobium leguminosarum TaxID=384 RepID=A0AAE2SXK6_RHILE|nr:MULTISPECIES: NAD(P)-dependent oxidoreductase [Rhizobium]MBB4291490.1 lactate dehydrogenase-like 2-hydroxyacid dehydrogenase [Rhizobium leguminosarum]MBB4296187.1 lactate dehydrogenase-like 2-hydroxyacid dehydrogenase [Rhizobium leguminosarum]MBB4308554.1 lactate dehydrogenase-like 2-hydroxyacid dehydrogenase [Rhizobium leguminosarum]MBB4416389.1 lactate dehydrogenase-like 2-hydroxyacid dehydrogenase [Rhizobium leguminosarum]MBB4430644.1 lactate dehydrogenase-like 2-hydroxyacid dehydrogenas